MKNYRDEVLKDLKAYQKKMMSSLSDTEWELYKLKEEIKNPTKQENYFNSEDILQELNNLVGMQTVKDEVNDRL
ncbi:MAG: hypothetical protein MUD14_28900 [Hydrococcus sp. Prado102]|jgi:hypothetical protein|nr:hypothetical protein [Hydrococcus sp. Prado102]